MTSKEKSNKYPKLPECKQTKTPEMPKCKKCQCPKVRKAGDKSE